MEKETQPLVSVIIPAYNSEKYLTATVESVLVQTYAQWELIIVDDGSMDGTYEIASQYAKDDNRIKVLRQNNSGVSIARNNGYRQSIGKYLGFLDADDIWLPTNLAEKVAYLEVHPSVGLVHTDMRFVDANLNPVGHINIGLEGNVLDDLLLWEECVIPSPSSILVKREIVEKAGLFDKRLSTAADQEFFFRVASITEIGRIPKALGLYRTHSANMSKNVALLEMDHILAFRIAEGNKLFKSRWFRNKCFSNMYMIIAGCWWNDAGKPLKGIRFLLKSILTYPPNFKRIFFRKKPK